MEKKGQGDQFNWIFIIIAGAVILGFFTMFIFRYIELEEKKQDIETVKFFSVGIISASSKVQVGSGGAAIDSQADEGVRFGYATSLGYICIEDQANILINKGENAYYKLQDEIVFMDKEIKLGSQEGLDLWILPWNYPFHITNFVYLANSKIKIYLVYDTHTALETIEQLEISSIFDTDIINKNELEIKSNSKIIFFGQKPTAGNIKTISAGKENVYFVNINNNKASFFDGKEWSEPIQFYGTEQLYGVIFSNDKENYACNIKRSLEKTKTIAALYSEKARILGQIDRRQGCNYASIANGLNQYAAGNYELEPVLEKANLEGGNCIWVF